MKAEQTSVMHPAEPLSDKIHSDKIHSDKIHSVKHTNDMLKTLTTTTRDLFKTITDVQLNQPTQQLNWQPTQQQTTQQQTTQQLKCKTSYGIICYNKGRIL